MSLEKVLNFGLSKEYFKKLKIKDIEKSCCNDLEFEIIDFDRTKDIVCNEANQVSRKSCDGLYLNESIDFIEFKSLNNFFNKEFKYKLKNDANTEEIEMIKQKVLDFNFTKKIRDSLWLFDYILNHNELELKNNDKESIYKIEKNYFIVKDEYKQPLLAIVDKLNMLAQDENNELKYRETMDILIKKDLGEIKIEVNRPKLMTCAELNKFLEEKENNG